MDLVTLTNGTVMKKIIALLLIFILISVASFAQFKKIKVACVGNSITWGDGGTGAYPYKLGVLLGSHYEVKNFGVGGTTLLKKGDFPYWNTTAFLDAVDYDAQIVIIKLGTNDSKPQNWVFKSDYYSDYLDLVAAFRKNGRNPQIYISRPVPVYKDAFGITGSIVKNEIIPLADSVRKTVNADLMDFNLAMTGHGDLFSDGIHPNAAGYQIMATFADSVIRKSPSGIIRSFAAGSSTFEQGQSVKLYWETTSESIVTINGSPVASTDSLTVNPVGTTVYKLKATGVHSDSVSVTVKYLPSGLIKSFKANPPVLDLGLGDSSLLSWTTTIGSSVKINGEQVSESGSKYVKPSLTTEYVLEAIGDSSDNSQLSVQLLSSELIDRASHKLVKTSSVGRGSSGDLAVDDDSLTYWISNSNNSNWIYVDLGKMFKVERIVLNWGANYATKYNVQGFNDKNVTTNLFTNYVSDGGYDEFKNFTSDSKIIRILCLAKVSADSGYTLKEFKIYGTPLTVTGINENNLLSENYFLFQNFPNPFNPATSISYQLKTSSHVELKIYDLLGREIKTLVNEVKPTGIYSEKFDASNLTSGIYLYRLKSGTFVETKKMTVMK